VCFFADACESHWGVVISQVPQEHMELLFEEQDHRPLMFLRAAARWVIVEKEAYAIMETLQRADYLFHPVRGFSLFIDHRKLKFIFNPHSVVASVPKYTAQKLERWVLLLMGTNTSFTTLQGKIMCGLICYHVGVPRCQKFVRLRINRC
jgi:hypothetical protein